VIGIKVRIAKRETTDKEKFCFAWLHQRLE